MTRAYKLTGRQSCRHSDYHAALHAQAILRADEYVALQAAGLSSQQIADKLGTTRAAVNSFLRRQRRLTR